MIDLETLGTESDAVFLSIAAVQFDLETGEIGQQFTVNVDIDDAFKWGRSIKGSTVRWWLEQKPEIMSLMLKEGIHMGDASYMLSRFIEKNGLQYMWGNSARFDLGILSHAYNQLGKQSPWSYKYERCYRTLKGLCSDIDGGPADNAHNPVADCLYQIKHLVKIWKVLKQDGSKFKDSEFEINYGAAVALLDSMKDDDGVSVYWEERIKNFLNGVK